jgi:predicted nucleic-acid-binding Zn-ribbon protein
MPRYSKRKPDTVMVKNRKLICPVCDNDQFIETRAQMNTAAASFFDLDWANKSARCFVCSECTYVFWFRT